MASNLVVILFNLVFEILRLFTWALILAVVFNLLASFGVLDTRNRVVWTVGDFLYRITEPVLRPIRRIMPDLGNVDLSPLVALLLIQFVVSPLLGLLEASLIGPTIAHGYF